VTRNTDPISAVFRTCFKDFYFPLITHRTRSVTAVLRHVRVRFAVVLVGDCGRIELLILERVTCSV
jgi:hypothetical protein